MLFGAQLLLLPLVFFIFLTKNKVGYGDYAPCTLGARICESAACIWGGVVTTMMIVVMINFLSLTKEQKKAFFDLTVSNPAALVIGSFFYYVRARNNMYTVYHDANQSYQVLEKCVLSFMEAEKRAEVVAADIISNEEAIAMKTEVRLNKLENKIDQLLALMQNKRNPLEIMEEEKKTI